MKYIKLMITAVLLTVVGRAHADNLKVANVELKAGETKEMAIELNNPSKQYAAFQFDLVLPDGVAIAKNNKGKLIASLDADRMDDHTLNVSDMGSNTYRFLSFSMTNAEFYGTSGALVKVTLQAADGIGSGNKTATIKSQVFTEVCGDQAKWSDLNFTITIPVDVKVTAPTAKTGLVYTGSAQELVSAGSTNVGTLQYSLDGNSYSATIPTGTDAKTYTVYYKAVDGNKDLTTAATLTATISPKTVSSPTITLSATSFVYDGKEKKPTVTVKDGSTTIPESEYTVSYSNNINVGTATVTIKDKDGGNYVVSGSAQFTITSAAANVTAPKAKSGLVYNGSAQELITAGSSDAGEMQYSLDGSNYSTAIPKGTDAKTYTVYYRVKGDANHSDIAPATLTATISPKTVSSPTITLSETSFVYDGKEKKPTVTVKDGNTTIPTSEYTVSYSNNVNVGTATVTITDKDGGNYIVSGTASFEIEEAAINVFAPAAVSGLVYNGNDQGLITPGYTSVGRMLYSLDNYNYHTYLPAMKHAMTYTVYYKVVDDTETTNLTAPASLTVTISKAPLTISVGEYTMAEGDQVPEFKLQYDGFKSYDTGAVLTTKPTITCKATSESAPGRYEITVSGAEAQDYDISYLSGWLTIELAQGIRGIVTDGQPFDVYTTQGRKVCSSVTSLKGLPKGVYIINGKKIIK